MDVDAHLTGKKKDPSGREMMEAFNLRADMSAATMRRLQRRLAEQDAVYLHQAPYSDTLRIVRAPRAALTPCTSPDASPFAEHLRRGRGWNVHFRSRSGRRLVCPRVPTAHMACFAREATPRRFNALIRMVQRIVRGRPDVDIATEGHQVGHLHVRLTPDPLQEPRHQRGGS